MSRRDGHSRGACFVGRHRVETSHKANRSAQKRPADCSGTRRREGASRLVQDLKSFSFRTFGDMQPPPSAVESSGALLEAFTIKHKVLLPLRLGKQLSAARCGCFAITRRITQNCQPSGEAETLCPPEHTGTQVGEARAESICDQGGAGGHGKIFQGVGRLARDRRGPERRGAQPVLLMIADERLQRDPGDVPSHHHERLAARGEAFQQRSKRAEIIDHFVGYEKVRGIEVRQGEGFRNRTGLEEKALAGFRLQTRLAPLNNLNCSIASHSMEHLSDLTRHGARRAGAGCNSGKLVRVRRAALACCIQSLGEAAPQICQRVSECKSRHT